MGKKLDAILRKGFKSSKCTALLKMSVSRIKLLRNRREIQCRQTRKDIAQLLQNGQVSSARMRVELVFREQNILDAYVLIEGYCHLVTERMVSIENQKTCPNDLKEAVASLIFAAARCADLPELQDIRSLFVAKYGNEFSTAAVELRPNCGVNRRIIEKLSTRAPSAVVKLRMLKEIAAENGIEWNFEKAEMEVLKPAEDLLDGPKHFFSGSQAILKPADTTGQVSVPENAKANIELNKRASPAVAQSASVSYSPSISPPIPSPGEGAKSEQQFASFVNQEHEKLHNAEKNDLPPLQAPPVPRKEESVESPWAAKTLETKVSEEEDPYTRLRMEGKMDYHASRKTEASEEEDPYTRLRMEGKMDYHASRKTRNSTSEFLNPNDHHGSTKFTEIDGVSIESTQDTPKYTTAAAAAQAAFESAAVAAEAARAAVNLAKSEVYNENSIQSGDDWKDAFSESELDEALEAALSKPIRVLESDVEEMSSSRDEDAVGMKNSKATRHETKDFSYPGLHFARVQPSQKVNTDSESEEEPSEAQISLSKASRSWASNYNQEHFDVYNDIGDKYGTNAISKGGKLHAKQDHAERTQTQSKRSMSCSASDSTDQYSSFTQPVFDNYDAEDEDENASSGKTSYQSVLDWHRRSEHDDSCNWSAPHTANRLQFDGDDEDDEDEKIMSKRYQKQDYISEIEREPNKSSFQLRPRLGRGSEDEGEIKALRSERSHTRLSKPLFDEDEGELEGPSPQRSGTRASKPSLSDDGEVKATRSQRSATGTRSSKLSFEDFVRQETRSFEYFNPQSDDRVESLNDFERKKFQNSSEVSIERRAQSEDKYDPLHGRALRQGIGATMSDDHSTYSAHAAVHKNYRSQQCAESNYSDFQSSDNNNGIGRSGVVGKAQRQYGNTEDQGVFVEGRRPQDSYCSKQLGFGEDNKAFQGLEIGDRSHSDGEYSTKILQKCDVHPQGLGNESKQQFLREDVPSTHSYGGPEPGESDCKDAGSRIDRMGQHKATHHGESRRSWRTRQQLSEQQNNSVNGRPYPPSNKNLDSQSINTGYTPHNNPLTISPEHDTSPFMTLLPPPPVSSFVKTGDNAKEAQKSSKPRSPLEQLSAIPSTPLYTNDEFSERLEALRRKR